MKTLQLIAIAILVSSFIILYMPIPFYRKSKRLTRNKFVEIYPQFSWLKWLYPLLQGIMILWGLVTLVIIFIKIGEIFVALSFLELWFCVSSIFHGGVVVFTGVRLVPSFGGYLFVSEEGTHLISWLQIILSLAIIVFATALALRPKCQVARPCV